eukprot:PhM_4_TR13562/c0_g1_i3/m.38671
MDERPSCHHGFKCLLLNIIHNGTNWVAISSHEWYTHLNDRVVSLPMPETVGAPHRTVLHARAYVAYVTQQLKPKDPFEKFESTPPKDCEGSDERRQLAEGLRARRHHTPSPDSEYDHE